MFGNAGDSESIDDVLEDVTAIARYSAVSVGLIFVVCVLLTLVGALTDNVRLLALAGLAWLAVLLSVRVVAEYSARVMSWICGFADSLAHLIRGVPLVAIAGYVIQTLDRWTDRFFYVFIGVCGFAAHWISALHIHLAGGNADEVNTLRSLATNWTVQGFVGAIPLLLGIAAQALWYFNGKNTVLLGWGTKFFTSFEFARCSLVLTAGFWGRDMLQAANGILAFPADNTILPLPFSQNAREGAFTIYKQMGPMMFWILLGIIPMLFFLQGFFRWMGNRLRASMYKKRVPKAYFRLPGEQRTVFAAGVWMLALSATVGIRSGDFHWWWIMTRSQLVGHAFDKALVACVGPFRSADQAELACWKTAAQDWDREFAQLIVRGAERLAPKGRIAYRKKHTAWRQSFDARYAQLEKQAALMGIDAQIYLTSSQVDELRRYCRSLSGI